MDVTLLLGESYWLRTDFACLGGLVVVDVEYLMSLICPGVTFSGPVCEFTIRCSSMNCVDMTNNHLYIGHMRLSQVCPKLLEYVFLDECLHCCLKGYINICVVTTILVVFIPFSCISRWVCSRELLWRR